MWRAFQHIFRYETPLGPLIWIDVRLPQSRDEFERTPLGRGVSALVRYAQVGAALTPAEASRAIGEIAGVLAMNAKQEPPLAPLRVADEADMADALGLVFIAAGARIRLASGQPLTTRELAALSGLSPQQVRHLGKEGALVLQKGTVTAAEATRWLAFRRVPGIRSKRG